MALNRIPAISESYPLFDWGDYQSSREALVKGTPTSYFAKAAWNAIVDDLADALAEAGLEWDETYTTAEGARMTDTDGQLTAAKFNSVRLNIDHPAPLGWIWAIRSDFRGYLGRGEVHGKAQYGKNSDVVVPEYIIELARKLNVLLEIMRGTALFADIDVPVPSHLVQDIDVRSQPSAPVETGHISTVQVSPEILPQPAAHIKLDHTSRTVAKATFITKPASSMASEVPNTSLAEANVEQAKGAVIRLKKMRLFSEVSAELDVRSKSEVATSLYIDSDVSVSANTTIASPAESSVLTLPTLSEAEVAQAPAQPLGGSAVLAPVIVSTEGDASPALPLGMATASSKSTTKATVDKVLVSRVDTFLNLATAVSCHLDSAWYPPKWVNGGLWIRQSQIVMQKENGELVIT